MSGEEVSVAASSTAAVAEKRTPYEVDPDGTKWVVEADGRRRKWWPSTWRTIDFLMDREAGGNGGMSEEEAARRRNNPYVRKYLASPIVTRLYPGDPVLWNSFMNHKGISKEFTEAWAIYRQVKRVVRSLCGGDWSRAVVFDIGCGKGYLGALVGAMQPNAVVRMLDKNKKINVKYLGDIPNSSFTAGDILRGTWFRDWVRKTMADEAKVNPNRTVGILTGIHLCGMLAVKLVETFLSDDSVRGFVLSPCCLASHKVSDVAEGSRSMARVVPNYHVWCLHILLTIPTDGITRALIADENMESIKNRIIVAKKNPASTSSSSSSQAPPQPSSEAAAHETTDTKCSQ